MTQNFWTGPHGVRVPQSINSIVAEDGINTLYKDGSQTEIYAMNPPPSKNEYLNTYAKLGSDGYYWYKNANDNFWVGPYGIRVPNSVNCIITADGVNILRKNGSETEIYNPNPPTKTQYLEKYTELRSDGYQWYKFI